jgi:hypothetical protein
LLMAFSHGCIPKLKLAAIMTSSGDATLSNSL